MESDVLTYLSQSPPDAARALEEIQTLAARYSPASSPLSPPLTLVEQLDHIPTEAWLTEFPFLDNCLRDSIRLNAAGSGFRKNVGGPQKIGGEVIKEGGIVIFPFASVHMDEEIYRKPYKWDPSRYEEGREEDKKGGAFAYLGWGVGRHPCLGMKVRLFCPPCLHPPCSFLPPLASVYRLEDQEPDQYLSSPNSKRTSSPPTSSRPTPTPPPTLSGNPSPLKISKRT